MSNPFATCLTNSGVPTLDCIPNLLPVVVMWAIAIAFIIALALIIYSAIRFITSGGDEKQVEGARKTLTYAIIGLILVLSSFFIVQFIGRQTGVTCISAFGFNNCEKKECPPPPPAGFCPARTQPTCSAGTGFSWTCK